jgi:phenylpyruvate tautomerase PptA (4-oxalocrotonate tautomerase family)
MRAETTITDSTREPAAASAPLGGGPSRRAMLAAASVAVGAMAAPNALAGPPAGGNFGAPIVELYVPAGALSLEQRAAMIKGVTDVVLGAMKLPPDPARRLFVEIIETAEGGFGVNGQVFVPRKL